MFIHISITEIFNRALLNILVLVLTGNPGAKQNDSIDVDVEKTKKILKEKISEKSLIVGHLAPFIVSKELISMAIVLRKNPYDLIQIYEKRNYTDSKKNDNLGSEILGVIAYDSIEKFGEEKTFQIIPREM